MKFALLRTVSAFTLAALLAACGAGAVDQPAAQSVSMQTGVSTTSATVSAAGTGVSAATGTATSTSTSTSSAGTDGADAATGTPPVASATAPQPDCAAEGCSSPRIIDGNAEAWRYAAMQRAASDVSAS